MFFVFLVIGAGEPPAIGIEDRHAVTPSVFRIGMVDASYMRELLLLLLLLPLVLIPILT